MKYIKISAITLALLTTTALSAQNLVPNPGFEDTLACPTAVAQIHNALGWVNGSSFSPDYYNRCSTNWQVGIPSNWFGYQQPFSGDAYSGISCYNQSSSNPNQREVIGINLTTPLTIGTKYYVSMQVSLANGSPYASNNLGMLFSTTPYSNVSPAPINNFAHVYHNATITDTLSWTTITGSFTADSAYTFVAIGNFFDDNNTDTLQVHTGSIINKFAYYKIDDVVVSTDSVVGIKDPLTFSEVSIYPNPSQGKVNISFEEASDGMLSIRNAIGQLVLRQTFEHTQKLEIQLNSSKGLYFLSLENEEGAVTKKILIE